MAFRYFTYEDGDCNICYEKVNERQRDDDSTDFSSIVTVVRGESYIEIFFFPKNMPYEGFLEDKKEISKEDYELVHDAIVRNLKFVKEFTK